MNVFADINDDVARYFRELGFTVTWDFDKRTRQHWYEIYDGDKMLVQIDFDVPLAIIKEALPMLADGKPDTTGYESRWTCAFADITKLQRVVARMQAA